MNCFVSPRAVECNRHFFTSLVVSIAVLFSSAPTFAQMMELPSSAEMKKMSVEDLLKIEVTAATKQPEKFTEVASAVQIITADDIRRSGATSLPEVLRLSPNLQVSQYNSYGWVISARGFNNIFSNKLLVMIDGRTVYSPLFAGVYWDVQGVLLEDIDRIEIISGPGGSLWGANAVNGVINIITKSTSNTKGLYVSGAAGSLVKDFGAIRYGGKFNDKLSYRIFMQRYDRGNTLLAEGVAAKDKWNYTQSGIRLDWDPSQKNSASFQANIYGGLERNDTTPSTFDGQNCLARWRHSISEKSELVVQAYFDRTWRRDIPSTFSDELDTYDLDVQHGFQIGRYHRVLWGAGYRRMNDMSGHSTLFVGFVPETRAMDLYSGFLQDEISLLPEKLRLIIGSKIIHNVFSGFDVQPSARVAWIPNNHHTMWAAVSRAVRMPSRIDVDYHIPTYPVTPGAPSVDGGPDFTSEKVIAYELGYRIQPAKDVMVSLAAFYNIYNDLYSVEPLQGTLTYRIQNGMKGDSHGVEVSAVGQLFPFWRVRGGYTYFVKSIMNKPGHNFDPTYAGADPKNQCLLQSILDLPKNFQFDIVARYVDPLPASVTAATPRVAPYINFDVRLAWSYKNIEVAAVCQNSARSQHTEFATTSIPRSVYGKITCRF